MGIDSHHDAMPMFDQIALLDLTKHVVAGYVSNNPVPVVGLPALIADVASALTRLSQPTIAKPEKPVPAVNPKRSVFPDYIVCLENGKHFKSLKRHLMTSHNLTPEQYREKWGLPHDYPMVAPNYAAARSAAAKKLHLGKSNVLEMSKKAGKITTAPAESSALTKARRKAAKGAPTKGRAKLKAAE